MIRRTAVLVLLGALVLTSCGEALEGSGDVVTEDRTVAGFDTVHANNGVRVFLTIDPAATGDVVLAVTTDSNLQEFLTTEVSGSKLTVSSDRMGGTTPTGPFDVSATVSALKDVSVDNGAQVEIAGSVDTVSLSANNGAYLVGDVLETVTVTIDVDNGAQVSVCATGAVSGEVTNGARLTVRCGGSVEGVETSDGGTVSPAS